MCLSSNPFSPWDFVTSHVGSYQPRHSSVQVFTSCISLLPHLLVRRYLISRLSTVITIAAVVVHSGRSWGARVTHNFAAIRSAASRRLHSRQILKPNKATFSYYKLFTTFPRVFAILLDYRITLSAASVCIPSQRKLQDVSNYVMKSGQRKRN